ncbi:MAG: hypothetical protein AAF437_13945 [Pseudomonadota bacterium]
MNKIVLMTVAIFAVSACWGAPPREKILNQLCVDLFDGDVRTERMVADDARSDVAGFCSCYAAQVIESAELTDKHTEVLVAMTELKGDGNDVEAVAEQIEDMTRDGRIDTFSEEDLDALGDYFRDLTVEMSGEDGACPA